MKQIIEIESTYYQLLDLRKDQFLQKLKLFKSNDDKLIQSIEKSPINTFFHQKILIYSKVFPDLNSSDIIRKVIYQLDDKKMIEKFYKFRSNDFSTLLEFAKYEDQSTK